jgi:acyl-CoA thioesterase
VSAEPGGEFELAKTLGMRSASMADGRCAWTMTIGSLHLNPYGIVHGGLLYTLMDYAMGGAVTSILDGRQRCTTLEIKMNYLAPASDGDVCADAWVVSRGGRIVVLQGDVMSGTTKLAVATGTFYIFTPAP